MNTPPTPPENVRLILTDGRELPVECRYDGIDDRGLHCWTAVTPDVPMNQIRAIKAAMVPALTSISLGVVL